MSWDVYLFDEKSDTLDSETSLVVLGPKSQVKDNLKTLIPAIDFSDPDWGILRGEGFSMEFNIGSDDVIDTIALHIRGGEDAVKVIQEICDHNRWKAFDTTTGEFIDFDDEPEKGFNQWQSFRDTVFDNLKSDIQADNKKQKTWKFWKW